ncbi:methionine adenosyltransferase [Flammeovirga yaeyamensis]|uniref:S-adenosylmethionine synthase n=1 Tax=Flammeovirga yaeyamensis TaxID=367791 RepID=A0AAX1N0X0_9BACT|nr:methionine adenosyltransferase [Flammeovirga yaeyamensis]MBB3698487.1 S-adenosylmethionine synthetase [Flammeovirga yaeyamensis]NMF34164.1 methionine adenosyltransferase [Flammeovirga yaeyamensis]QWG01149.1 methionine adenosyltransferase [Flammeovirga yaeyamensis]
MTYLFTSESVSEGHPDKIADQISDSILDAMLAQDPTSRVACETMVTTGLAVIAGEITTKAYVEIPDVVRETIDKIGYNKEDYYFAAHSCGVQVALHSQSPDIAQGVNVGEGVDKDQGAGDQGMMFGYATKETPSYMPMALAFSHGLVKRLAEIRKTQPELIGYLRPDAKAQVTIEYNEDNTPKRVHTIVVSTQHDEFPNKSDDDALAQIAEDVKKHVIPAVIPNALIDADTIFHINPTGKFVIGGPHGDAGLTGRKIIVDTYGGKGAHGGGAFSGKDPSKVDRSAAYAARHIAKNLVAAGVADEALVQVAYAIGVSTPVSLNVQTYGTSKVDKTDAEISNIVNELFDMRPKAIVDRLGLTNPIFSPTAAYGHMGQEPYTKEVELEIRNIEEKDGKKVTTTTIEKKEVEFFTWEKLDYVDKIKSAFGL